MSDVIIDFHTHAFPDELAQRALAKLAKIGNIRPHTDGTIAGLQASMDRAGIDKSVVCSIATKPGQFDSILAWSKAVRSDRIIPLPSLHPKDRAIQQKLRMIRDAGFLGIKMHPYYQDFDVDEERMFGLYEGLVANGLFVVMHTGFDIGYPRIRRADPPKIIHVLENFPKLCLVTTHFGAWDDWDLVQKHLLGKEIFMEVSFTFAYMQPAVFRSFLLAHPNTHILFGSDCPWSDQKTCIQELRSLQLPETLEDDLFGRNACRLLGFR
jgi:predicted TIM-barrel fold metal-dependent hydrolase